MDRRSYLRQLKSYEKTIRETPNRETRKRAVADKEELQATHKRQTQGR